MPTERIIIEISERGARQTSGAIDRVGTSAQKTTSAVDLLRQAFRLLVAGAITRGLINLGDTMISIGNKVGVVTDSVDNATFATSRLFDIARETRAPIAQVAQTFQRMSLSADSLGVSQERVLKLTRSLTQAVQILGASGHESTGAMIQLAQGLGAGELRGQELNSVLEQAPVIAEAIAKQLGVSTGELKKLGAQGKITAKDIFFALEGSAGDIADQFGRTTATVSQGLSVIKNAAIESLGTTLLPLIQGVANTMLFLADNVMPKIAEAFTALLGVIKPLVIALAGLAAAMAANFVVSGGGALALLIAGFGKAVIAVEAFGLAISTALGPIGLVIAAGGLIAGVLASISPPAKLAAEDIEVLEERGASLREAVIAMNRGVVEGTDKWDEYQKNLQDVARVMGQLADGSFVEVNRRLAQMSRALEDLRLKGKQLIIDFTEPFGSGIAKVTKSFRNLFDEDQIAKGRAAAKRAAEAFEQLVDAVRGIENEYDPLVDATRRVIEIEDILTRGVRAGIIARQRAIEIIEHHRLALLDLEDPYSSIVEALQAEQELLKLSTKDREIQMQLLEIQAGIIGEKLTPAQLQNIEAMLRQNQALRDQKQAVEAVNLGWEKFHSFAVDTTVDMQQYVRNLNHAIKAASEAPSVFEKLTVALEKQKRAWTEVFAESVTTSINAFSSSIAQIVSDAADGANSISSAIGHIISDIANGAKSIRESFHRMAKSIVRDITRILVQQAILRAILAFGGGPAPLNFFGGGVPGGYSFKNLQHGGEWRVGGSGGPDSQLVAFRASPNETVSVKTPGQQAQSPNIAIPQARPTELRVINAFTPAAVAELMRSPEGAQAFLNVVRERASEFRDIIEYG